MMDKLFKKNLKETNPLNKYFYELENSQESPFTMALTTYENLRAEAKTGEELFYFLIEDSLFTSLNATFYEQLLMTMADNREHALPLLEKYAEETEAREQVIAASAQDHFNFIENLGMCSGCKSCENHTDVSSLISPFQKGDIDFFTELYIGMQTIQFTMEFLIYDVIPNDQTVLDDINQKHILEFRKLIYEYASLKIEEYLKAA